MTQRAATRGHDRRRRARCLDKHGSDYTPSQLPQLVSSRAEVGLEVGLDAHAGLRDCHHAGQLPAEARSLLCVPSRQPPEYGLVQRFHHVALHDLSQVGEVQVAAGVVCRAVEAARVEHHLGSGVALALHAAAHAGSDATQLAVAGKAVQRRAHTAHGRYTTRGAG